MQMNLNARQQMEQNKVLMTGTDEYEPLKKYKGKYYKKPTLDESLVQTLKSTLSRCIRLWNLFREPIFTVLQAAFSHVLKPCICVLCVTRSALLAIKPACTPPGQEITGRGAELKVQLDPCHLSTSAERDGAKAAGYGWSRGSLLEVPQHK